MIKAGTVTLIQILVIFSINAVVAWATNTPYNFDSFLAGIAIMALLIANEAKDGKN